ncbi:MAG: hypothetical protein HXX20_23755 [Chloroflexi bacterium]|nr:hypothetical protein [Chloroflexota bacterium]
MESRTHRKDARPVRRGGVGVLGQPRPGLLPDDAVSMGGAISNKAGPSFGDGGWSI